ncbi:microtubule-associated protein 10 isoform X2 [Kogia breviceps]|uniref:microtubule-associated protein 10 isoform X2 n=1 Tax=Kogia breviceps TaxID=27615 RepID=UPI0027962A3D|nr:microtubule-associated protein 10 isoform X2 [Kogia breviceps]XP_058909811.1 microtubule-associated protein 10 isoform X2 [Kogia breviceps]XP_058909812.1 microtubule-associated protein 10 isoform X2 [Kogia breviceps]XP_058909813.1 microtubule-associated protein 10 isoform X2 [Kogia breviceps]XP_058909814.1 microtubule-associated protein 10 isoform X2 [Kogia breviceps]XP_058909815.1 microtubule-associated protein 10 isoform X2 [Kogia breviceps]
MAAALPERLFSLELLVDWVRLEAGLPPPPVVPPEEQEEEEASPPRSSRGLCPAVAFRLLDFPTLLVYPPGGMAAPAPELRPGLVSFGRGKSCLFRLQPATLHRLLLRTPLYTLLLQLPPGRPTPAPQLLGACSISLAAAAHKVLGPAASGCSQGHRGSFPLHNLEGERIGHIALGYRLTDLGSSLLGHLERPVASTGGGVEGMEVSPQSLQENQQVRQPDSEPRPRDADKPLMDVKISMAGKDLKEGGFHSKANSDHKLENGKTNSIICSKGSSERSVSPPNQEVTELDIETNIICPPPLYYTHVTQEKTPPKQGEITIEPQMNAPEELDGTFPEEKLVNPPTHSRPPEHTNLSTHERPPVLIHPAHIQDVGASNQTTYHPQTEQNRINTVRQLPLLSALLVELSLLYNQPMASPTHIHPHLACLYRTEDKKSPESSAKSTCKSESKDKLPLGENEKSVSLQYKKNQTENLKKGKYFEKKGGVPPKRVPRGKLLYGLTNTLKLRLKQTNPDMLIVHEKREQYRKTQAQMLGAKLRIPSSKVKTLSFAEQHQKPHQLPKDKFLDSDASFAEDSNTSKQISVVFDDPSTTKETKLKCAAEKTVDLLEEIVSPANSIVLGRFIHTNILGGRVEVKVQSPGDFQRVAVVDRIVVGKEIDDKQVKITSNDILTAVMNENNPSTSSCSESISELKYSDDFTSPCCSEDTSRILQARDSSPGTGNPKHSQQTSKSSETRLSTRKNSSEKSSILSPPFSAGSPVLSYKRFHISKAQDKSLEEASNISTSDFSLSHWTEEKENQREQNSMHNSKVLKRNQDIPTKLKTRTGCKSSEKSQSPRTSQDSTIKSDKIDHGITL